MAGGRRRRSSYRGRRSRRGGMKNVDFSAENSYREPKEEDKYPDDYFYGKPTGKRKREDDEEGTPSCESVYFQKFPCVATYGRLGDDNIVLHDEEEYRVFQDADRNSASNTDPAAINIKVNSMMRKGKAPQVVSDKRTKFAVYQDRPALRDYLRAHGTYPPPPAPEPAGLTRENSFS